MLTLNEEYIKQTLKEERMWKVGEADSFNFKDWELTLRREEKIYIPFKYSVRGSNKNGSSISRRYVTMEDAFLHILNSFNDNANVKNKYNSLEQITI